MYAQEEKKAVSNLPPAADNRPSIMPDLNTQSGVISKQMTTAAETPSPFKKDENKKTTDGNADTNTMSAENLKTLNGTAEIPRQLKPLPASNTTNLQPQEKPKPVALKLP